MTAEPPLLSIVTGTRNRPKLIADMVSSILENTEHSFEILIGDCSDGALFTCEDPRVRVIPEPVPLGFGRGYNKLFKQARGDFVCYLNDDLVVLPGWSTAIFDVFERHPEVDMACIPVIEPDEPAPFLLLFWQIPVAQFGVLRREAGEALGWFDERYRFYAPDVDLSMRVIDSGRRLAPVFGRVVRHFRIEDSQRDENEMNLKPDNKLLFKSWKKRRWKIIRKYRKNSFRYFEGFETRQSGGYYNAILLTVPEHPDARPRLPSQPYLVERPGIREWLGFG